MKFIQLNAWEGNVRFSLVRYLKKERADIVNLQEVTEGFENRMSYFSLYGMLKRELKYRYSFYSPLARGTFEGRRVSQGDLILSLYPIERTKTFCTRNLKMPLDFSANDFGGLLQHARINVKGTIINDLNYHGTFVWGTKMGNRLMELDSKRILAYMNGLDKNEKTILSGDFNLAPNSKALRIISQHYPDLISRYGIRTTRNELCVPKEPVDNILVNRQVKVRSLKVPLLYVSDHLPLVMRFD